MLDYREIENLIKALDKSALTSLEIAYEGMQINMKKECTEKIVYVEDKKDNKIEVKNSISNEKNEISCDRKENVKAIKSPIVGTFYSKPSPDRDTYVKEGDEVKKGQVVCIIEAMKLMNEVKSEFNGEIIEIIPKDGDLIEYGQEIFLIKEN